MNNHAFLITAYKQLDLCEEQICRIRQEYKTLNDSLIVIVSTSEEDIGFENLSKNYNGVIVIRLHNAPGSPNSTFVGKIKPETKMTWRGRYLAARVLYSMAIGLNTLNLTNIQTVFHTHSDSHIAPSGENNLVKEINQLLTQKKIIMCDEVEDFPGIHPEGLTFNLDMCKQTRFGLNFFDIYKGENLPEEVIKNRYEFHTTNYVGTEGLLLHWAAWTFLGKNYPDRELPISDLSDYIIVRQRRTWHGVFVNRMVNLPGEQPAVPESK